MVIHPASEDSPVRIIRLVNSISGMISTIKCVVLGAETKRRERQGWHELRRGGSVAGACVACSVWPKCVGMCVCGVWTVSRVE